MRVNYRPHRYQDGQDRYYVVDEEVYAEGSNAGSFATGWQEYRCNGARLRFYSMTHTIGFIMALDDHRGNFTHQGLVDSMVVN